MAFKKQIKQECLKKDVLKCIKKEKSVLLNLNTNHTGQ